MNTSSHTIEFEYAQFENINTLPQIHHHSPTPPSLWAGMTELRLRGAMSVLARRFLFRILVNQGPSPGPLGICLWRIRLHLLSRIGK
jgi:hypothetical protein